MPLLHYNPDASRAITSNLVVPCPEGLAFDPYQLAAVDYAKDRVDTLIGDAPGLGKTIEAIGLANFLRCETILVICPGYLKPHWQDEFDKWKTLPLITTFIEGRKSADFAHVTILNYELLEAHAQHIREIDWDLLIVDEAHRLKSGRADRTKQVFGGIKRDASNKIVERIEPIRAARRVFLTGTPVLNGKPKELWPLLRSIDPEGLGKDWFAFAKRYCGLLELTRFDISKGKEIHVGWKWDGAENLEEMQEIMRKKFMIRRLKSDVLKQLPEKRRMVIPLIASRAQKKLIKEELTQFETWVKQQNLSEDAALELPDFGNFSTAMKELGLSMVEPAIEVIENELESVNKLVVMCYHNEVAEQLHAAFPESILINGNVPPDQRFALAKLFQEGPANLIIGTIGSMGEGLTLTAASVMLFIERPWVPGAVTQGEDRIHRRGQLMECLYKHLVLRGSLSERQVKILLTKQEKNDRLLDRGKK